MLIFYCLIGAMIILALFSVTRVLLRIGTVKRSEDANQVTLAIYEQHLDELAIEKQQGIITDEQEVAAKSELDRALLDEIDNTPEQPDQVAANSNHSRDWLSVGIITLLLPVIAVALYYELGAPALIPRLQAVPSQQVTETGHGTSMPSVEAMVEQLAQRLQENPDDLEGLFLLARSYMSMRRFQDAADIYKRIYTLTGDRPEVLLPYADALAMAGNGRISGLPEQLIQKALRMDPGNATGLWLAGLGAFEHQEYRVALDYWQRLLPQLKPGSKQATDVEQMTERARVELGDTVASATATAAMPTSAAVTTEQAGKTIDVKVALAPGLVEQASLEQTVFIYAQPVDGPPMPVAVVRKQVKDLPLEVTLDDSMAMMPTQKLSNFKQVKISARISPAGNASPRSGDLIAETVNVDVARADPIILLIDRRIP